MANRFLNDVEIDGNVGIGTASPSSALHISNITPEIYLEDSNNTADVIDRNQLIGQIYIQPAKTAEFVVLDFTIEPTGATFGA